MEFVFYWNIWVYLQVIEFMSSYHQDMIHALESHVAI